jgi:tetratricopeptide (TPR) repeat protein
VAYHRAGHPHLARAAYELVLAADARHPDAQYNLGLLHYDQERLAEAASWLESAIFNDPDHKLARWNLTLIRLAQGDFRGGWKDYSMRWQVSGAEPPWLDLNRKRWAPGQQSGRVLAWSEQGLGDTILFSGFLDALRAQVPELRAAVDPRLIDLLSRSYPGIDFVSKVEDPSTLEHDHHVPIGDVPYLLSEVDPSEILGHEGESNCFPQPRLVPDWPRAKEIRGTELQSHLRIVGISWRSTHALTGTAKSLALRAFVPLLRRSDLLFVNLQYGEVHDEIEDLERTFGLQIYNPRSIQLQEDLDGLAALICCCDAVVTCSNTTAHLAGALGRKTFLLAPHGRALHWYWRNRNSGRSRWYPSVSIIDQSPIGSWEYSVEQLLHRV